MGIFKPLPPRLQRGDRLVSGLASAWEFTEGSGTTAYDLAGRGNNLSFINGPTWAGGGSGSAISFNSAGSQYLSASNIYNFQQNTDFSVFATIKTASSGAIVATWAYQVTAGWRLDVDGVIGVLLSDANAGSIRFAQGSKSVNDNREHLIGFTYNGDSSASGINIYVDGVLDTPNIIGNNDPDVLAGAALYVGRIGGDTPQYFNGTIGRVRIYDRTISDAQVRLMHVRSGP